MKPLFTPDFFVANRVRLRELCGTNAPIVLTANGLLQRNGDSAFSFRQDSSFWYLTGIDEPDIVLVMDTKGDYLIVPGRDSVRQAFDGAIDSRALAHVSGIDTVLDNDAGWERLTGKRLRTVLTPAAMPGYDDRHGLYGNPARARLIKRLRSLRAGVEFQDIRQHLMRLRSVKQPPEIEAIQQAIDITIDGLRYVTATKRLQAYDYEYELEADLSRAFRNRGARHAFEPIVAAGERACQLHYLANNGALSKGQLMVLDVGAEVSNYAADISRTVVIGEASIRQQQVYSAVLEIQAYAIRLLKPGAIYADYEKQIENFMGEKLRELGLIQTISHENVRAFYPHATSHFMGLDVHDVGDYRQPLQAGMVLTCEPGIYIPAEGIGVRIEDDVLITDSGNRVMTEALKRQLA